MEVLIAFPVPHFSSHADLLLYKKRGWYWKRGVNQQMFAYVLLLIRVFLFVSTRPTQTQVKVLVMNYNKKNIAMSDTYVNTLHVIKPQMPYYYNYYYIISFNNNPNFALMYKYILWITISLIPMYISKSVHTYILVPCIPYVLRNYERITFQTPPA